MTPTSRHGVKPGDGVPGRCGRPGGPRGRGGLGAGNGGEACQMVPLTMPDIAARLRRGEDPLLGARAGHLAGVRRTHALASPGLAAAAPPVWSRFSRRQRRKLAPLDRVPQHRRINQRGTAARQTVISPTTKRSKAPPRHTGSARSPATTPPTREHRPWAGRNPDVPERRTPYTMMPGPSADNTVPTHRAAHPPQVGCRRCGG